MTVICHGMLAGLVLDGAACTTGGGVGSEAATDASAVETEQAAPAAQMPCADTIDPDTDIPASYTVILDVVALSTADSADAA